MLAKEWIESIVVKGIMGNAYCEMQPVKCIMGNALSDGNLNAPRKTDAEKTGYTTRAV